MHGSDGMLVSGNQYPTQISRLNNNGTQLGVMHHSFPQRYADSYVGAMDHFLDVLLGKKIVKEGHTSPQNFIKNTSALRNASYNTLF